jgi:uncharacterized membrane protein
MFTVRDPLPAVILVMVGAPSVAAFAGLLVALVWKRVRKSRATTEREIRRCDTHFLTD